MATKFTVLCDFAGQKQPFDLYVGDPKKNHHPLDNQSKWLSREKNGNIPAEVMTAVQKLYDLSIANNVNFEKLVFYAFSSASENNTSSEGASDGASGTTSDNDFGAESEASATENTSSANAPLDENAVNVPPPAASSEKTVDSEANMAPPVTIESDNHAEEGFEVLTSFSAPKKEKEALESNNGSQAA